MVSSCAYYVSWWCKWFGSDVWVSRGRGQTWPHSRFCFEMTRFYQITKVKLWTLFSMDEYSKIVLIECHDIIFHYNFGSYLFRLTVPQLGFPGFSQPQVNVHLHDCKFVFVESAWLYSLLIWKLYNNQSIMQ